MSLSSFTMSSLSRRLTQARDAAGLNNKEVAERMGLDESTVSLWMRGKRTPRVENLQRLAVELGIEVAELWQGDEVLPATPAQRAMVEEMADMTPAQQEALLALARTMRSQTT